jgi:chemotaxis protein MotA
VAGLGLVILFALIIAFFRGGDAIRLLDLHAAVVVIGGTLVAGAFAYPQAILGSIRLFLLAVTSEGIHLPTIVAHFLKVLDRVRQQGRAAAGAYAREVDDAFLRKGLQLVAEGFEPDEIRRLLEDELSAMRARHRSGIGLFEGLGGFAPTFGILGTVEAMIGILGNLEKPERIGLDIAVAMVATLYGVGIANLVFIPIANRLRKLSEEELRVRQVMVEVLVSLQEGAKPEFIRERLRVALPPETRRTIAVLSERRARRTRAAAAAAPAVMPSQPPGDEEYYDDGYGGAGYGNPPGEQDEIY